MLNDRYGNAVSTSSAAALAHYDEALLLARLYRGDPVAALDAALGEDPGFTMAWAARGAILVQQGDRLYHDEVRRSLDAGAACRGTDVERAHLAATADWLRGYIDRGVAGFMRIARDSPRDLLALQTAHIGHFYLGRASDLRDGPLQALRGFSPKDDGYHAVLGMAAFGLEECGDYARAEASGGAAVDIEPRDAWALHAVAHVHEMRGDTQAGIKWLTGNEAAMAPDCGFSYHNWWHLALLHMDRDDHAAALSLYDQRVRPDADAQILLEWIDASALLWRLQLEGVDTGNRFARLAACWTRAIDDRLYSFNDCHAIMAFVGAGQMNDAQRSLTALREAAGQADDNAAVVRAVGLPIATALVDFAHGRFAAAAEALLAVRGIASRFGGSHAQRDVLTLTAFHAADRAGMKGAAEALATERLTHKPDSPWARRLAASLERPEGTMAEKIARAVMV